VTIRGLECLRVIGPDDQDDLARAAGVLEGRRSPDHSNAPLLYWQSAGNVGRGIRPQAGALANSRRGSCEWTRVTGPSAARCATLSSAGGLLSMGIGRVGGQAAWLRQRFEACTRRRPDCAIVRSTPSGGYARIAHLSASRVTPTVKRPAPSRVTTKRSRAGHASARGTADRAPLGDFARTRDRTELLLVELYNDFLSASASCGRSSQRSPNPSICWRIFVRSWPQTNSVYRL
jgi:hypothetical protein